MTMVCVVDCEPKGGELVLAGSSMVRGVGMIALCKSTLENLDLPNLCKSTLSECRANP